MTNIDLYQQCPCGSGKKLKFCCGSDISHELEAIQRAMSGHQRIAALDLVQRAVATKGARPALLMIQIQLAAANDNFELAESALRDLQRIRPKDAATTALRSRLMSDKGDVRGAVESLHDALELIPENGEVPVEVAIAFRQLGTRLVERGATQPGIAHLAAASQLVGHQDQELMSLLQQLNATRDVPLAAKEIPALSPAPEGVAWRADFDVAKKAGERGLWRKARNLFRMMAEGLSQEPTVLKNLAIMQTLLGDAKATAAAWRVYARLPSLPLDDAVEAEAQALLADPGDPAMIPSVTLRYPIKNLDACSERLLSDRRCFSTPIDPSNWDAEQGPPPKSAFMLLDRELPTSAPDIALADVPRLLGHLFVFGKQTDRPALLEVEFDRDEKFDARLAQLQAVAGEFLDAPLPEEVTDEREAASLALSLGIVFPRDVSAPRQMELAAQLRRDLLADHWTKVPLWECGGRSAADAAKDPKQKLSLLAAILLTEVAFYQQGVDADANTTRERLGLPRCEPIVIDGDAKLDTVGVLRLGRVDPTKLADNQLAALLQRAVARGHRYAQSKLALEAAGRSSTVGTGLALSACEVLVSCARDRQEALEWITKGRQLAAANNQSAARIKILELEYRLLSGEYEVFGDLLRDILANDIRDDRDAAIMLYSTMSRLGLVTQEGKFVVPAPKPKAAPLGAAGGAAGIWTPGSGSPAAAAPNAPAAPAAKSKLWLPGMD